MTMFKDLTSFDEVNDFINQHELVLLFFTTPGCSVCHGLQPQIEEMMTQYPHIKTGHVDASAVPEAAGQFSVFTAPVILLFVKGKEYVREARIVQTQRLNDTINRIYNS